MSGKNPETPVLQRFLRIYASLCDGSLVPLAGIEPALLAELDFESSASTSSATGAFAWSGPKRSTAAAKRADYSGQAERVNPRGCDFAPPRQPFGRGIRDHARPRLRERPI